MSSNRTKRNIIAILIAVPVIYLLSLLNIGFDHKADVDDWDWKINIGSRDKEVLDFDKTLTRITDLAGDWHFAAGDDLERGQANFDHSTWGTIKVPSYWEGEGYKDYDGYAWYRRTFELSENDLNKPLYAVLGRIDDADEVFINGQRIGGMGTFPPTYVGAYDGYRNYSIAKGIVHKGENVIAVRVFDAQMSGGIYDGDIGIYASSLPSALVNLQGDWQFKVDDDMNYRVIQVPGIWENQGYEDYDGLAWYKKDFVLTEKAEEKRLVLLLGKIDDTDEVFLNGELIGRTGTLDDSDQQVDPDYYLIDRQYEFSADLLRENNTIELRVHDSGGEGGIYKGPVSIMGKAAFLKFQDLRARSN